MARNVEIKARIDDMADVRELAESIADHGPVDLVQDDIFFRCEQGRLKLRVASGEDGELIFYRRDDRAGPKESFYLRSPVAQPDSFRRLMAAALGQSGRVRKRRTVYLVGRSRIHLDSVDDLGHFLELEVALETGESVEDGTREANRLLKALGINEAQLVDKAYVDLLGENPQ